MARPGGHGTVEHRVAHAVASRDADRMSDAERVDGELARHHRTGVFQNICEQIGLFIQGPAAKAKPVKTNFKQGFGTGFTQLRIAAALNDAEDERSLVRVRFSGGKLALVSEFRALCPLNGAADRKLLFFERSVHVCAVIQANQDVRAVAELELMLFRRESVAPEASGRKMMPFSPRRQISRSDE